MTITIQRSGIKYGSGSMNASGVKTLIKEIIYNAGDSDTDADLLLSPFYPQRNEVLVNYPAFKLKSVSTPEWADAPSRSCRIEATYETTSSSTSINSNRGAKPWELGVQGVRQSDFSVTVPATYVYDMNGKQVPFTNFVGLPFKGTMELTGIKLEFSKSFQGSKTSGFNTSAKYNSNNETVLGIDIPKYCGKLLPTSREEHTVYKDDGSQDYTYTTLNYCIMIFYGIDGSGWIKSVLQTSTLAKFNNELSAIWKYYPLTKSNSTPAAKFGSIKDVINANNTYQEEIGDTTKNIPFEEMTEPLPIDENGALKLSGKPDVFKYIDAPASSWNSYDLPKE